MMMGKESAQVVPNEDIIMWHVRCTASPYLYPVLYVDDHRAMQARVEVG